AVRGPLDQSLVHDSTDPQWSANPDGPPSALLERPLHPGHGMGPLHAGQGADGSALDGEGRFSLPLPMDWFTGRPPHDWLVPSLALHKRSILGPQRPDLCHFAVCHWAMGAPRAYFMAHLYRRLDLFRPICDFPSAKGTGYLLSLQRAPAAFIFLSSIHHGAVEYC